MTSLSGPVSQHGPTPINVIILEASHRPDQTMRNNYHNYYTVYAKTTSTLPKGFLQLIFIRIRMLNIIFCDYLTIHMVFK